MLSENMSNLIPSVLIGSLEMLLQRVAMFDNFTFMICFARNGIYH